MTKKRQRTKLKGEMAIVAKRLEEFVKWYTRNQALKKSETIGTLAYLFVRVDTFKQLMDDVMDVVEDGTSRNKARTIFAELATEIENLAWMFRGLSKDVECIVYGEESVKLMYSKLDHPK